MPSAGGGSNSGGIISQAPDFSLSKLWNLSQTLFDGIQKVIIKLNMSIKDFLADTLESSLISEEKAEEIAEYLTTNVFFGTIDNITVIEFLLGAGILTIIMISVIRWLK